MLVHGLMPWGRCDDSHYDHPKVRRMPREVRNAADGLYWRAISLCNRRLTDGWLTEEDIELIDGTPEQVEALVTVGMLDRRKRGLRVHDFLDFNKSKSEVLEERERKAAAGRRGGVASGKRRRSKSEAGASQVVGEPLNPRPVPSRPVPDASNEASPPDPPDVLDGYYRVTGRPPSQGAIRWLERLEADHGAEDVVSALGATASDDPDPSSLLERTQFRLVQESREAEARRKLAEQRRDEEERQRIESMPPEKRRANMARLRDMMRESGLA